MHLNNSTIWCKFKTRYEETQR